MVKKYIQGECNSTGSAQGTVCPAYRCLGRAVHFPAPLFWSGSPVLAHLERHLGATNKAIAVLAKRFVRWCLPLLCTAIGNVEFQKIFGEEFE